MANSEAFEHACGELESITGLNRLEARGTMRLVLKHGGLDATHVSAVELSVLVEKLLTSELTARGVGDAESVCRTLIVGLARLEPEAPRETPDTIFARLGGEVD